MEALEPAHAKSGLSRAITVNIKSHPLRTLTSQPPTGVYNGDVLNILPTLSTTTCHTSTTCYKLNIDGPLLTEQNGTLYDY